ncbi:hypothetical protein BHM03_00042997 [Ensete ventricosum]|nr:hypothetical protein BHM03_00042997 [Ensete ventricosum]
MKQRSSSKLGKKKGIEEEEKGKRGEEKGLRPSASARGGCVRAAAYCSTSVSCRGNRGGAVNWGRKRKKRRRVEEEENTKERKELQRAVAAAAGKKRGKEE